MAAVTVQLQLNGSGLLVSAYFLQTLSNVLELCNGGSADGQVGGGEKHEMATPTKTTLFQ